MKEILKGLYRRILYKIPLKFLLILLAVCAIMFASFSNAVEEFSNTQFGVNNNFSLSVLSESQTFTFDNPGNGIVCYVVDNDGYGLASITDGTNTLSMDGWNSRNQAKIYCSTKQSITITPNGSKKFIRFYVPNRYVSQEYPNYTSLQCQTEYNLIPVSSVDSSYCQGNGLCPSGGNCSGDISWSALYINNIQHIGGPNIYIDIPEEFNWDYEYQNEDMYIDIEGYNVDYDKITGIIDVQNYKPSSEDFSYIVKNLIPLFIPGLVIILFIYWLFRFIKKIF